MFPTTGAAFAAKCESPSDGLSPGGLSGSGCTVVVSFLIVRRRLSFGSRCKPSGAHAAWLAQQMQNQASPSVLDLAAACSERNVHRSLLGNIVLSLLPCGPVTSPYTPACNFIRSLDTSCSWRMLREGFHRQASGLPGLPGGQCFWTSLWTLGCMFYRDSCACVRS